MSFLKRIFYFSLASSICLCTELNAKPIYLSCNAKQAIQLIQKFKLLSVETLKDEQMENRADCIQLNDSQILITTANITGKKQDHYKIAIDLIDVNNQKQLINYQHPQLISEENGRFSSVKFDRVPYSNLQNENVIGLKIHHLNNGYFSYDLDKLNLFRIVYNSSSVKNNKIQWILKNISTQINSSWRPTYECDEGTTDEIKSILILKDSQNHQLQDILLKQTKKSVDTDEKCKTKRVNQTQQQLLKFNGDSYQINRKLLLISEDLKAE